MKELAAQVIKSSLEHGWDGVCQPGYPKRIICADPRWQPFYEEQYRLLVELTKRPGDNAAGQTNMML